MSEDKFPKGKSPNAIKHQFKPGQSGNPKGGPKHLPGVNEINGMLKRECSVVISMLMQMDIETLQAHVSEKKTKSMEVFFGVIIIDAIQKRDTIKMNWLLDRTVGKVPDAVKMNVDGAIDVNHSVSIHKQIVDHIYELKEARRIESK